MESQFENQKAIALENRELAQKLKEMKKKNRQLDKLIEKKSKNINFFNKKPFAEKNDRFEDVQAKFNSADPLEQTRNRLDQIKAKLEAEEVVNCTFNPLINKSSSQIVDNSNYVPIHKRPLPKAKKEGEVHAEPPAEPKKLDPDFYKNQFEWKQALKKQYETEKKQSEEKQVSDSTFAPLNSQQMRQQYILDRSQKLEETKRTQELRMGQSKKLGKDGKSPKDDSASPAAEKEVTDHGQVDQEDNNPFRTNENDFKSEGKRQSQEPRESSQSQPVNDHQALHSHSHEASPSQTTHDDFPKDMTIQNDLHNVPKGLSQPIKLSQSPILFPEDSLEEFQSFASPSLAAAPTQSQEAIYTDYINDKLHSLMAINESSQSIKASEAQSKPSVASKQLNPRDPSEGVLSLPLKDDFHVDNQFLPPVSDPTKGTPTFKAGKSELEDGGKSDRDQFSPDPAYNDNKHATFQFEIKSDVDVPEPTAEFMQNISLSDQRVFGEETVDREGMEDDEVRELKVESRRLSIHETCEARDT